MIEQFDFFQSNVQSIHHLYHIHTQKKKKGELIPWKSSPAVGFAEIRNDESSAPGIKWAWINPSRRSALDSIKFFLFLQTLFLKQNGLTNSYFFKIKISRTTPLSDCECKTGATITWYIYRLEISYSKHFEEEIWGVDYINECWIGIYIWRVLYQ